MVSSSPGDGTLARVVLTLAFAVVTSQVAHWPLDETTGSTALDIVGSLTGTKTSGVSFVPDGGVLGGAASSLGTGGQRIEVGDVFDFVGRAPYSTAAWVFLRSHAEPYGRILSKLGGFPSSKAGWAISIHDGTVIPNSGFTCVRYVGDGLSNAVDFTGVVAANVWYHVTCTYDGSTIRVFVDGALRGSVADTRSLADTPYLLSIFGTASNSGAMLSGRVDGLIDDVRIYDVALTPAEVMVLATRPQPLGSTCGAGYQCVSGFCVDEVCCENACGAGLSTDCQTCSTSQGSGINGRCQLRANGAACRAAADVCDIAETCSGASTDCPGDAFRPATFTCRPAAGVCDVEERCSGSSAGCPVDALESTTFVCREAAGACDVGERCSGASVTCPDDTLRDAGEACRAAAGACDVGETCTGSGSGCPADGFEPEGGDVPDHVRGRWRVQKWSLP